MAHDALTPRINDLEESTGGPLLADSTTDGAVKKNRVLIKASQDGNYTSSTNDLLPTDNIPAGTYRLTVGGDFRVDGSTGCYSMIRPQLDNTNMSAPQSAVWTIGLNDEGAITEGAQTVSSSSSTVVFSQPSTFTLHLYVLISGASSGCRTPFFILEKLENVEEITTEWD